MINNLYYGSDDVDIDCFRNASFKFNTDVLATFLRRIYNGFDTSNDVEPTMWREILRIINEATVDGLVKGNYDTNIDKTFLDKLAHSNEVFSAFKVHNMGVDMAKKMRTDDGKLKPFSEWKKDIKPIASHYCGAWLQTEYNTATLRAKFAAEWKQYEADADIFPNLRWMPTTSANPEEEHKGYWMNRLTLPVGDKFWDKHHPGDHWNCKCSLEQTDEPANPDVLSHIPDVKPQKGLAANPGKTGVIFDDKHPYFPKDCSHCWTMRGIKNKGVSFFNQEKVHCMNCMFINECTPGRVDLQRKAKQHVKEYKEQMPIHDGLQATGEEFETGSMTILRGTFKTVYEHSRENMDIMDWLASFSMEKVKGWSHAGWARNRPLTPKNKGYDPNDPDKKKHEDTLFFNYYKVNINGKTFYANVKVKVLGCEEVLYTLEPNKPTDLLEGSGFDFYKKEKRGRMR